MDVYAHCAEILRARDRDRYLADLFAPQFARHHLFALHAFNAEIARVPDAVSEPALGEMRLQWWRDALRGAHGGHPVATALGGTIAECSLPLEAFERLLDARVFDLYQDPMPSMNDLEAYAGDTSSALIQLAAIVLAKGRDPGTAEAAGHAGVAYAMTGLLRALPFHAARRQFFLPADRAAAAGVSVDDVFAGTATAALGTFLAEMRSFARHHLAEARRLSAGLDPALAPAFLPLALVEPYLDRMARPGYDPLHAAVEIAPWRRQWLLWREARRA
jgi:phytoene synthase